MAGLVDVVLGDALVGNWRRRVCAQASGDVVELGFGSGRNLAFYPDAVTRVLAVDPSDAAWESAHGRIEAFGRPVTRIGADAADLPLPDSSVDCVVAAWTLCTVPQLATALAEAWRVCRPGGSLLFVEHGAAPTRGAAAVQRVLQPAWGRVAGGCHLDREIAGAVRSAGWELGEVEQRWAFPGWPLRPWTWFTLGRAVRPK